MKYPTLFKSAALVLAVAVSAPVAVAADEGKPTPSIMTDTAPLPAQDRASSGAIILEDSMVLAQREAFMRANERTGLATIGRNAMRATLRQTPSDVAELRKQQRSVSDDR
jgi:hypothetical protein